MARLKWNNNFNMKRRVGNTTITIGEQNFDTCKVMVKEQNGHIIQCPMMQDANGNIYFVYKNTGVYISDYLGNFSL